MTTENEKYSHYISRRARTALFSETIVSMGLIGSALIMLNTLV
ncbi:MAG: hypothetical protein ACR2O0_01720 [Rhizobiaceae bacterium]